jgi:hypothetical protein
LPEGAPIDHLPRELAGIAESIAGVRESAIRAGGLCTFRVDFVLGSQGRTSLGRYGFSAP